MEAINQAFRNSITEFNYQGKYRGVFPIKVNQLREVVEEILDAGKAFDFGLEVGSKPELFAGLALQNQADSLVICNGYKDAEFIRMALLGIKLGKRVIMVVEKLEELRQIIVISKQIGVEPLIGIRARLLSKGAGKWAESGGENAKFGLSTVELLSATELLRAENLGHCLKLLHFHIGSQVPDILTVKKAVQEAAHASTPNFTRWVLPSNSWMWAAGWGWITTDRAARLIPPRIIRCKNTRTTSFIISETCATRRKCRTRTSSARAAGQLWRITAC